MKVLVTGAKGQLGSELLKQLEGHHVIGADREEMDLGSKASIEGFLEKIKPDAIIHCGAYTAVDKAEDEKDLCLLVNSESVKVMADYCKATKALLIFISSDYVFDGTKPGEYTEVDIPNPQSVYGQSKWLAENYITERLERYFIVRISWVFGEGANFVKTMLRLSGKGVVRVVADQYGSPTYTVDLAPVLIKMLESPKYGTYHVTNEGFCSWHEFAKKVFETVGVLVETIPLSTAEYPTKATRPKNSRLSKVKLEDAGFGRLPHWEDALTRYLQDH